MISNDTSRRRCRVLSELATHLASTTAQNASSRGIPHLDMLATPLVDVKSLFHLDPNSPILYIDNNTPCNEDWHIIGSHFAKVQKLHVSYGFCHNLKWYSLENWESLEDFLPFVDIGETEERRNRMLKHYAGVGRELNPTKTKTLEIIGDNAIIMFIGFCLQCFPAAAGLEKVTLQSADYNDMGEWANDDAPEEVFFATFLLVLEKLKVLRLSVGERLLSSLDGLEVALLRMLWRFLPRKLEELHFRGPVGLAPFLEGWIEAFGDGKFLPSLKWMSLLECEKLREAAAARGSQWE
ncbi:hypothetical protein B0H65DRAFT_507352 [Neurospora tetraspora]|uniref:Uncharacterized protein n=1 Tax=Neurospora tetraspora TaxID=94610 RepID=A0AAE0MVI3_9PEZI|nr:hypothetical protein B0H65DRAFT_507352 [Neurospora tetraspora]